mmetsp:Transcript_77255/g.121583  ORF Transcript_77255/g.121583 Transcript_77255/m.121583 type:complete len:320 (+) Transcript_77255:55-1014(+)
MASSSQNSGSEPEFLEDVDEEPTEDQVIEYAEFLGMDLKTEEHLLWIAREGVAAPVPHPWKTCTEKGEVFYFNFETSESSWDHPSDAHYRDLLEKHRKGLATGDEKQQGPVEAGPPKRADAKEEEDAESFVSEMVEESEAENDKGHQTKETEGSEGSVRSSASDAGKEAAEDSGSCEKLAAQSAGNGAGENSENAATDTRETVEKPGAGIGLGRAPEAALSDKELSEVSEDFPSDWGAPSPLGSSAPGSGLLYPAPHSLEVSASDVTSVLGPGTPQAAPVKSWAVLKEDVAKLMQVLSSMEKIRQNQTAYLQRLRGGAN